MAKAAGNRVLVLNAHSGGKGLVRHLAFQGRRCLSQLGLTRVELSIFLVDDRLIGHLNRIWRKMDQPTDVLSFPAGETPEGVGAKKILGDVVISLDTARRRSGSDGVRKELSRYLVHGLLHLLGYDHRKKADARRMARRESSF